MKVGIVFGAFDLLHAGHTHLLRECKMRCDRLVVGLHVDPSIERPEKNKPVESLIERQLKLSSNKYVDDVIVYETEKDIGILLQTGRFNMRFLGSDYQGLPNDINKKPVTAPTMIEIEYIKSLPIHTSDIRERIKNDNK